MNKTKTMSTFLLPALRAWLAVLLLVIVSSFEVIKVIHIDHHHGNELPTCTENDEANACHRSVVHFDTAAGCEHTQHLEKIVAACEICDALITTYVFEVSTVMPLPKEFEESIPTLFSLEKRYSFSVAIPALRGPPFLS